jgi:hypothetical protein
MSTPGDALLPALVLLSPAVLENGLKATFVAIIALLPFELAIGKKNAFALPGYIHVSRTHRDSFKFLLNFLRCQSPRAVMSFRVAAEGELPRRWKGRSESVSGNELDVTLA